MIKYGLLGYPLGHSFSKRYFEEKFDKDQISAIFENFELPEAKEMLTHVNTEKELIGFCITIPHKEAIIPYLDSCDDAITKIGAVNCVKIRRDSDSFSLKGYNTDVIGFEKSFKEFLKPEHKKAIILGTGGASKAVEYVLEKLGISYHMVSRVKTETNLCYEDVTPQLMSEIQLVINTTPLGMYPKIDAAPNLPYENVSEQHYFYDLVYNPKETLFLSRAKAQGAMIKCGMDMLELQAEANWNIWNE